MEIDYEREALGVALMVANDDSDALTEKYRAIASNPEQMMHLIGGMSTISGALIGLVASILGLPNDEVVATFLDHLTDDDEDI